MNEDCVMTRGREREREKKNKLRLMELGREKKKISKLTLWIKANDI
jgi:hypothetical protein